MRYLIKYTKESEIKFIAHLDLMRTIQKVVRRAKLPAKYSKGFNPHLAVSIAQPLSVGVYSSGEYMDLILVEEVDEQEILDRLNEKSAAGIKFLSCKKIVEVENEKKLPQGMALIDACRYTIKVLYNDAKKLEDEVNTLLEKKEWNTIKKSKKGEREVDIRALVYDFKFWIKDNELIINTLIQSGSREHLSADLLVNYVKLHTTECDNDAFVDIKREEMYFLKEGRFAPLCDCR
ncbi:TIGR03936 family radical SAM-associated protein [Clostridium sp. SHJSY1]|uniref:TIGR03936 family radical SAM-associated protein n=1 Tax=Clostridium sp. SHJSY1 TaxID=2942483 RepID=UPI0028765170|nr:TIGR03936 family radical SAM-associated protein [Clostridium sp. SHJSY1]MDS0528401.1 TIGR03936 family radical SAM-associated protein [Clostridium sp. SHJSY1]